MKKSQIIRRRGTTIAAAAFSMAMVAPLVHPIVSPAAAPAAIAQEAAPGQERSVDTRGTSEATAIRADGTWGQKQGYQGTVYLDRDGLLQTQGESDEAMAGVKVFLQYVNGKGQVSPIYYTTSDSEGKFVFDLSNAPKDGLGNPIEFKLSGDSKFQVRTWAENPDPAKYTLAAGGDMYSGRFHDRLTRKWESWDFTAGINRIVGAKVVFQERPNVDGWLAKSEDEWTEAPTVDKKWPEGGIFGTARGRVWWENNERGGSLANQYYKRSEDRAATDVKVVGSYVNDEVAREFDAWKEANENHSREQFRAAQKEIVDEYQAKHGEGSHIAESRVAYVKDDGSFYLPFAGLYGVSHNKKGNQTSDAEWGQLVSAEDEEHGNLMQWNGTLGQRHRHINADYMYLYPVVGENRDLWMGNYQDNMFQPSHGGELGIENTSANISVQHFALLTPRPIHDVINYDNASAIAAPGDTAKSKTTGLVPNQEYAIEWFADGESTGETCTVTANELGELESCDFTVPKDLSKPTVYSSQVFAADASGKPTGTLLLADSFLADPTVVNYDETKGTAKEKDLEAKPSFDNPNTDAVEEMPEGATFEFADPAAAEKLGLTIDPKTGAITWPADKQVEGENEFLVKVTWTPAEGADPVSREVPAKFDLEAPTPDASVVTDPKTVVEGQETDPFETAKDVPEGGKVEVENLPDGLTVDPESGEVTGTPDKLTDWGKDEEERDVEVTVTITDKDGNKIAEDKKVITVQRDTDGDGTPDVTDEDDDGDGVSDEDEKNAGTDPKDSNSVPSTIKDIEDKSGTVGEPIESFKIEVDNVPTDGSVKVEGLPDGVTYDPETGEVSGTPEKAGKSKVTVTVLDKDGNPVKGADGKPVTKTFEFDVKDKEVPPTPDTTEDKDKYEPEYKPGSGKPGEDVTVDKPDFKDKDGNPTEAPDGTKFTPGENAPEGVKVDENTGEITVPVPEGATPGDEITVPVEVTYPDGSKDNVDVTVTVDEPDAKDKDADSFEPEYKPGSGKPGEDVTVDKPDFKDKDGNPTEAPDGTKFTPGENAPEGVKVDENTGEITVPVPEGATPGDEITVPVEVTYPDGSKDNVDVTVTVDEPDAKDKDADSFEPEYKPGSGKPGEDVTVDKPDFKDKDGNPTEAPDGTKFTPGENAPEGVKVDENTGEITVPVPEGATPGDEITVPVEVTYPDGSKDNVDVTVTVDEPDAKDKDADSFEPEYKPGSGKPGEDVTVDKPDFKDKDGNPTTAPDGTKFTPGENAPEGVKVDENTGEITVPVPQGATPGDEITVPVEVTYPDGSKDNVDVTVTVEDPNSDAAKFVPEYGLTPVEAGKTEKADPFKGKSDVPVKEAKGTQSAGSEDWKFKTDKTSGVIDATAPTYEKVGEKISEKLPEIQSHEAGKRWDEFVKEFTPFAKPSVDVNFEYNDGSENSDKAGFDLVGKDGKSLLTPDGDFDGDGISNRDEIEKGSNPSDGDSVPDTQAPTIDPVAPGDREITGKDDRPNTSISVTIPGVDEPIKTTTDENGNWKVEVPSDVELKPGDKITVTDEAGNSAEATVEDTKAPSINEIKPGDKTVSGKGDRPNEEITVTFPGGKTVTTSTDENGNWKVNVPSGVELKPGDKVTATDGAGNKATAQVGIDAGKCAATAVGFGLPLIALIPIGLATQMQIPGLSDFVAQANAQIQAANTQIQQQAGLFNPQLAAQVDAVNQQLGKFGADVATVAGGLALIAAGILAGTLIYDNCSPNGASSSVKDLELKGSSGKTYAGSSKDEKPAKQEGSSEKK